MRDAAAAANHVWPEYAAAEAALETGWGTSSLYTKAHNIFGNKLPAKAPPEMQSISMATAEYINGKMEKVPAQWILFADDAAAFSYRVTMLTRLNMYGIGNRAKTGEEFVRLISAAWNTAPVGFKPDNKTSFTFASGTYIWQRGLWSTDPARAFKVKTIHDSHSALFAANPLKGTP